MANQAFTKISTVARQIDNLTISNNLRIGGTTLGGQIDKTLIIPAATAADNLITITPEQSGTTFLLDQSPTNAFTQFFVLPPAAIGLNYTFICRTTSASSGPISIMPYGYTTTDGNLAPGSGIISEAYANGIQSVISIGIKTGGFAGDANVSDQINSVVGDGNTTGGIIFKSNMDTSASLKLTCISTSTTQSILTGCRWVGTGRAGLPQDIDVTA